MADLKLGNILPVGADKVVVEGKYVKGGYIVVATIAERDGLITEGQGSVVKGSLCYCQADDKYYTYTGSAWVDGVYTKTQIDTLLSGKQATLVSGTNIRTINGMSLLDVSQGDLPAGLVDDVQQNGVSIVENKIANIILETGLGQDSSNSATVTAIRAFVNSSIEASAAYYITSNAAGDAFATKAALDAGPWYYAGHTRTPTRNDYAIVTADETHEGKSARYCYTENQWAFQYTFNMSFTQAQVNAINSGVTAIKVALYDAHLLATNNPHNVTKAQVGLENVGNFKAVSTEASQGLSDTEKVNARTNIGAGTGSYDKPDDGIPSTDMTSAVQTSLGLADTSIQTNATESQTILATNTATPLQIQTTDATATEAYVGFATGYTTRGKLGVSKNNEPVFFTYADGKQILATQNWANTQLAGKEDTSNKVTSMSASSTDVEYPSAKAVYDAIQTIPAGYESVTIDTSITTMAQLAAKVDEINNAGRHAFFDMHNQITGAYVCLVQKYTESTVDYMFIFDLLNRHVYGSLVGYSGTTLISDYIAASGNNNDLPYVLKITDTNTTLATMITLIDQVNALGQHVLIDVSALNTKDYLITFSYKTGASVTACKAIGLVNGTEAYKGYTTAELSTTLLSTFLNTAGDLSSYFVGTYAELKLLKDNSLLIPGAKYRLTDYELDTCLPYGAWHNAAHAFDIILTADLPNWFNENCTAALHTGDTYFTSEKLSQWKIKYQFDNTATVHKWASTNGKGVIFYLKDDRNITCSWDFKNLQWTGKFLKKFANQSAINSAGDSSNWYSFGNNSTDYSNNSAYASDVNTIEILAEKADWPLVIQINGSTVQDIRISNYYTIQPNWTSSIDGSGFTIAGYCYDIDLRILCMERNRFTTNVLHSIKGTLSSLKNCDFYYEFYDVHFNNSGLMNSNIRGCNLTFNDGTWRINTSFETPNFETSGCQTALLIPSNSTFIGNPDFTTNLISPTVAFTTLLPGLSRTVTSTVINGGATEHVSIVSYRDDSAAYAEHLRILKCQFPGWVPSMLYYDTYTYGNVIKSTFSEWNAEVQLGNTTPAVILPVPKTSSGRAETISCIFTAATTTASFTAPANYVMTDTTFTGMSTTGNTITLSNLETGHLYIVKFKVVSSNQIIMETEDWGALSI